jgi:uncharacterized membrane protein
MNAFYWPFALTIIGMLFYHISQKSVPRDLNPFLVTIMAYVVGIVACAIFTLAYPTKKTLMQSIKDSNWAVVLLGLAAASIELGFLLAYRAGWRISVAAVACNVAVTILLIPIGVFVFKDHLSIRNLIGLAFCIAGLALVARD